MPLIECPDCGKSISDAAPACIGCGRPMTQSDYKPEEILPPDLLGERLAGINCGKPMNSLSRNSETIFKDEKTELDPSLYLTSSPGQNDAKEGLAAWLRAGALLLILYLFSQFLLTILSPFFPSSTPPASRAVSVQSYRSGTINGYDSATGSIIDPINVFNDYENRNLGISGKAKHGEKVTILEKSGNGVRIKTGSGVTGWISSWFVKED